MLYAVCYMQCQLNTQAVYAVRYTLPRLAGGLEHQHGQLPEPDHPDQYGYFHCGSGVQLGRGDWAPRGQGAARSSAVMAGHPCLPPPC